jgi:type II secretory pathway component PulK
VFGLRRGLERPPRSRDRRWFSQRGIALLVVISTLALISAAVADFQFNSRVDLQLAFNARDGLQAEYNALSAMRLRAMILKQGRRVDASVRGMAAAVGLDANMLPSIGQILELVPIDCDLMSAITKIQGAEEPGAGEETPNVFDGECSATSHSEHAKISLNALVTTNPTANRQVTTILVALLSNPAFERHFQEDDRNGTHAENPAELVGAIADWIDRDHNQSVNQVGDEDRHYTFLKKPYKAKNAPFDSLAELQLVHGIDDELYDLLKNTVSIYADSTQIEVATASDAQLIIGLLSSVRPGANPFDLLTHPGTGVLFKAITEMRQLGGAGFGVLKVATLTALLSQAGLDSIIDPNLLRTVFTDNQGTTWYTIQAEGRVGNATRRMTAVFQAIEGQFYYFRME